MTPEERMDRLEHVTAGWIEQSRRQFEEDRQLWRDTQRQLNELSVRVVQVDEENRRTHFEIMEALRRSHEESVERDRALDGRVDKLVSGIGELLRLRNGGAK